MNDLLINPKCPGCVALSKKVEALEQLVIRLQAQIQSLEEEVAKSRKNSSNSSKPPSSDIVKPKPPGRKRRKKRRIGGQPGHTKHERTFDLSEADQHRLYTLERCPTCGGDHLEQLDGMDQIRFQYELVEKPVILTAHQTFSYWCAECQKIHQTRIPNTVRQGGLVGPRLSAMIGSLKGGCHSSYSGLSSYLEEVLGVSLSTGMLAKVVSKVSTALKQPYEELLHALPDQDGINIDETSHPEQGQKMWNWVFRTPDFTVFAIHASRGAKVLEDVLGKACEALVGSDYYSSYRAYMNRAPITVQFCLAHLIREARYISQSVNKVIKNYGQRVLEGLKEIFKLIHRREKLPPDTFIRRLEKARDQFLQMAKRTQARGDARTLAQRFRDHGKEYFTFITNPQIDPTNNVAERALRFCVIDRRITQGTRGVAGRKWCERIWTTMVTCRQNGRRPFDFILRAVQAFFDGLTPPSLLTLS